MTALVIGAGPAGLMAAQMLAEAGLAVTLADQMPSPARKFLMAGKSGLNLTRDQDLPAFLDTYTGPPQWRQIIADFGPKAVQAWARDLGQDLFTGSTGRVFPRAMKASPLLRAWLARLDGLGVQLQRRWRWTGWDGAETLFDTPSGAERLRPRVTVLALGGGSWQRLGSDGAWVAHLPGCVPFAPSNAGLRVAWSAPMERHFGSALKGVALHAGGLTSRGEAVITRNGLEGGGVYALTPALRTGADLSLDLTPDLTHEQLRQRLNRPRGKASQSTHLRKTLGLPPVKIALLHEVARPLPTDLPTDLPALIKALPLPHQGPVTLDQAISTAGGLGFDALTDDLMLRARPGVFCAGEMLDWDAPTGGYLLTGCLASGRAAGRAAAGWAG